MSVRKIGARESIIQLCTCLTLIILTWSLLNKPLFDLEPTWFKVLLIFITGLGAIGFYVPLGLQIRKGFDWLETKEQKK